MFTCLCTPMKMNWIYDVCLIVVLKEFKMSKLSAAARVGALILIGSTSIFLDRARLYFVFLFFWFPGGCGPPRELDQLEPLSPCRARENEAHFVTHSQGSGVYPRCPCHTRLAPPQNAHDLPFHRPFGAHPASAGFRASPCHRSATQTSLLSHVEQLRLRTVS